MSTPPVRIIIIIITALCGVHVAYGFVDALLLFIPVHSKAMPEALLADGGVRKARSGWKRARAGMERRGMGGTRHTLNTQPSAEQWSPCCMCSLHAQAFWHGMLVTKTTGVGEPWSVRSLTSVPFISMIPLKNIELSTLTPNQLRGNTSNWAGNSGINSSASKGELSCQQSVHSRKQS